jgi:hypothetical protein
MRFAIQKQLDDVKEKTSNAGRKFECMKDDFATDARFIGKCHDS